eukprot:1644423-Rhodomonas_salina.1
MDRGAHEFGDGQAHESESAKLGERPAQQHKSRPVLMDQAAYEFGEHLVRKHTSSGSARHTCLSLKVQEAYKFGERPAHASESEG